MEPRETSWIFDLLFDPHLKKALFLRRLSTDASAGLLSDDTLRFLELLAELDLSLGTPHPHESMKAAYAAVAVELTTEPLRKAIGPAAEESDFLDAVERIWTCRVTDLERSDSKDLVGDSLREWRRKMEYAMVSDAARERLRRRDTRGEAVKAVREYVRVAMKGVMGHHLMELVTKVVGGKADAGAGDQRPSGVPEERVISAEVATVALGQPGSAAAAREIAPFQNVGKVKGSRLARETDTQDIDRISGQRLPPIQDVNKAMKAPKPMCVDLPKVMEEPLPEPMVTAADVLNRILETPANPNASGHDQHESDIHVVEPSLETSAQATATEGTDAKYQQGGKHAEMRQFSFLERNPTARTMEWDEDLNVPPSEKSADFSKRLHLMTTSDEEVSPQKLQKVTECARRRKIKKWTPQEEDTLREAVKRYGKGRWKFILQCYSGTFQERTEVDLKDKWRNLSRYPSSRNE